MREEEEELNNDQECSLFASDVEKSMCGSGPDSGSRTDESESVAIVVLRESTERSPNQPKVSTYRAHRSPQPTTARGSISKLDAVQSRLSASACLSVCRPRSELCLCARLLSTRTQRCTSTQAPHHHLLHNYETA